MTDFGKNYCSSGGRFLHQDPAAPQCRRLAVNGCPIAGHDSFPSLPQTENDILTMPSASHFCKTLFGCIIFYILTTSPQRIVDGTFVPPALQRRAPSNRREALELRRVRVWGLWLQPEIHHKISLPCYKSFLPNYVTSQPTAPVGDRGKDPRSSPGWSRGARSNSLGRSSFQAHCQWGGVITTLF